MAEKIGECDWTGPDDGRAKNCDQIIIYVWKNIYCTYLFKQSRGPRRENDSSYSKSFLTITFLHPITRKALKNYSSGQWTLIIVNTSIYLNRVKAIQSSCNLNADESMLQTVVLKNGAVSILTDTSLIFSCVLPSAGGIKYSRDELNESLWLVFLDSNSNVE